MNAEHEADIIVNNIKRFFQNYKKVIYLCMITFSLLVISTMAYQWHHNRYESRASEAFFTLMTQSDSQKKLNDAKSFVNEYPASPYASLAKLLLISDDLKNGNWQGVDMQVRALTKKNVPDFISDQAYLLQARRFLATNQGDKALVVLSKVKNNNQVSFNLVKGLAENQLGNSQKATDSLMYASELLSKTNPESSLKNFIWYQQANIKNHE